MLMILLYMFCIRILKPKFSYGAFENVYLVNERPKQPRCVKLLLESVYMIIILESQYKNEFFQELC